MTYRASNTYDGRPAYSGGRAGVRSGSVRAGNPSRSRAAHPSSSSRARVNGARTAKAASASGSKQSKASKQTLFSRASQSMHDAKRARSKKRAQRMSGRQFASTEPAAASAGPRAALYKGEMGKSHRQAQSMMSDSAAGASSAFRPVSIPAGKNASHTEKKRMKHPVLIGVASLCALVMFSCAFMYGTLQTNYKTMREYERTQAEYAAVVERNNELQESLNTLSTDSGVKAYAHETYGWVSSGENSVTVQGLEEGEVDKTSVVNPSIQPGSVKAPEQWYTKYLDALFGVSE